MTEKILAKLLGAVTEMDYKIVKIEGYADEGNIELIISPMKPGEKPKEQEQLV